MALNPVLVRERDCYTVPEIARKFGFGPDDALACVRALLARGVLTLRTDAYNPGGSVEAIERYQFTWVGLAGFHGKLIVVYPKYYPSGVEPTHDELQQLFCVLGKASGGLANIGMVDFGTDEESDPFALMLRLLESYEENGVYSNYVHVIRDSGTGEIAWNRTIASTQPFMDGDTPVYFDLKTRDTSRDEADFVARLHRCVLAKCFADLEAWGIDELLSLPPVLFAAEELEVFGDTEAVCYRLEQERLVQFVTWKQDVIGMLLRYLNSADEYAYPDEELSLGTSSFYHVWEVACKVVFDDRLSDRIDSLGIELRGEWVARGTETLIGIIPRPKWTMAVEGSDIPCGEVNTFIPDVVAIHDVGEGGKTFCIYDAKYYTPTLGEKVHDLPGVESVTKQILYQSAYEGFVRDNGFTQVVNAFLVPTHAGEVRRTGRVTFLDVFKPLGSPFVDRVDMWELPAGYVFECYLRGALADVEVVGKISVAG